MWSHTFCISDVTWRCGIQTIRLKHGCDLTNVLATRRFPLLVPKFAVKQDPLWTSCRWMLTLFELLAVVFLLFCVEMLHLFVLALHPWIYLSNSDGCSRALKKHLMNAAQINFYLSANKFNTWKAAIVPLSIRWIYSCILPNATMSLTHLKIFYLSML